MRIQPRQHLLETWRSVARVALQGREWTWGGSHGRNSVSDAEQLLCLMAPATKIDVFKLDQPDQTAEDVLEVLEGFGDSVDLPRRLMRLIADYLRAYVDTDGRPTFGGGSYLDPADPTAEVSPAQRQYEVVDSYSTSVQLMLASIGFLRVFRGVVTREDLRREIDEVESLANERLTAAMLGLLRSFTVHVFDLRSSEGEVLTRTVNQTGLPQRRVIEQLLDELREVRAGLLDLTIGITGTEDLDNPHRLFECGWSWSVVRGAPPVDSAEQRWPQPDGVAQPYPYLYFTAVALDGIRDLFTERTRLLNLLDERQHRLARTLQIRWDLTQQYWARIARFGEGRWPLEDIPWRTLDDAESDYFTLLVGSIMVQALAEQPAADEDLIRVGRVFEDLASRARITRRAATNDQALQLHRPGVAVKLEGSEADGPQLSWRVADFSPQLLRRTLRVAGLLRSSDQRRPMLDLADSIWDHLARRRHRDPACELWDQPSEVYAEIKPERPEPSWGYTQRVVDALIAAAEYLAEPPLRGSRSQELAADQLAEAEHLFDQEMLLAPSAAGPSLAATLQTARTTLRRARIILPDRPATAMVLANDVLRELERLVAARQSSSGVA